MGSSGFPPSPWWARSRIVRPTLFSATTRPNARARPRRATGTYGLGSGTSLPLRIRPVRNRPAYREWRLSKPVRPFSFGPGLPNMPAPPTALAPPGTSAPIVPIEGNSAAPKAATSSGPALRYGFEAGRYYGYDVKIVAETPEYVRTNSGYAFYKVTVADSSRVTLYHHGRLYTDLKLKVPGNHPGNVDNVLPPATVVIVSAAKWFAAASSAGQHAVALYAGRSERRSVSKNSRNNSSRNSARSATSRSPKPWDLD